MNGMYGILSASIALAFALTSAVSHADAVTATEAVEKSKQAETLIPENERGDLYSLSTSLFDVYRVEDLDRKYPACAPSGTSIRIGPTQPNGLVSFTITALPIYSKEPKELLRKDGKVTSAGQRLCTRPDGKHLDWADSHFAYMVDAVSLAARDYVRQGFTFGALVVPFKFHVGDENQLTASSTIAPYVGYTVGNVRGMNLALLGSAGLGLVPIDDPVGESETKPALSLAIGLLLTSVKNTRWSSGVLLGYDLLGDADRARDPVAGDPWISVFVGKSFE